MLEIDNEERTSVRLGQDFNQVWCCCVTWLHWLNKWVGCCQHKESLVVITILSSFFLSEMFFHLDAYKLREMYENEVDGIISHTFHFHLMEFNKMTTSLVSLQVLTLEKVDKITLIRTFGLYCSCSFPNGMPPLHMHTHAQACTQCICTHIHSCTHMFSTCIHTHVHTGAHSVIQACWITFTYLVFYI